MRDGGADRLHEAPLTVSACDGNTSPILAPASDANTSLASTVKSVSGPRLAATNFSPGDGKGLQQVSSRVAPSSPTSTHSVSLPHLAQVAGVDRFDAEALAKLPPLSAPAASAGGATTASVSDARDAGLRHLAILQSLVARQTIALRDGFPPLSAHAAQGAAFGPLPLPSIHFPLAPPSTPDIPASIAARPSATDMAHHTQLWHTNLEGLNRVTGIPTDNAQEAPLGSVTADELLAAQASLELWSATVFNSDSPATSPPRTSHGPLSPPDRRQLPLSPLDWSTLYPNRQDSEHPNFPDLSVLSPFTHGPLHGSPPSAHSFLPSLSLSTFHPRPSSSSGNGHFSVPPDLRRSSTGTSLSASPTSPPPLQLAPAAGRAAPARRSSRANARAGRRSSRAAVDAPGEAGESGGSRADSPLLSTAPLGHDGDGRSSNNYEELSATYTNSQGETKPREDMTPEEVEEDKRRRNTEASARFRAKKKMRDAELKQSSASLRERVTSLEREKDSLSNENRWLRDLLAEKAEVNPRIIDVLRHSLAE